jgi:transposase
MRFAGIDVGSRTHVVAVLDEIGQVLVKPTSFGEDAAGYERLLELLGSPVDLLIAMEATGHYGRNLFGSLAQRGFSVALLNPLRTRRFAEEDLTRAKTDAIDALGIARFAAQKRPTTTPATDPATDELRELVRLHDRLDQDFGDRLRQLHRLVDLCFPEFTRHVRTLDSQLAMAVLRAHPTAQVFSESSREELAKLCYDGRHVVGKRLARDLVEAARLSVGRHHAPVYCRQVRYLCSELEALRAKVAELRSQIEDSARDHPIASLIITIDGLGLLSAARIVAAVEDPARFRNAGAFAAYIGVVPGTNRSGLRRPGQAPLCPLGNARLRKALYMPVLGAVRRNPWLRDYYERLLERGKRPKVALMAAMRKLATAIYSVAKNRKPFVLSRPRRHPTT